MSKHRPGVVALVALVGTTVFVTLASAAPPPAEVFGQRPAVVDVDINPAGSRLAWIEDTGPAARVIIHEMSSGKDLRTLNTPAGMTLRSVAWADDETLLIRASVTYSVEAGGRNAHEWERWLAIDASGGKDRMLLMNGGDRQWVTGADMVRRRAAKPGTVLMSTLDFSATHYKQEIGSRLTGGRKDEGWISSLYEVDLKTGDGHVVEAGTPFTLDWASDESAQHIVRTEWEPKRNVFGIYTKDGGGWRRIYQATDCGMLELQRITADNSAIIVRGKTCEDEHSKLWSFPLDGAPAKVLLEDPALDVAAVVSDPLDDAVLGVIMSGSDQGTRWIDARAEKRNAGLHRSFEGHWISLVGRSSDYKRVVVRVEDEAHPPIYYLVDYNAKTADIINEAYPKLTGVKLGTVRQFDYQARDNYALMAYLTVPAGVAEKSLPLVVMPHGGPESRDGDGFDWMAQFLASRGYAVLQPQFRGSSGFGIAHAAAGRHQWGLRMQDDVTDAVHAVIDQGIADPKRVCIVGASYGGYAALAGAAFTPELYACAVSLAGVSDLPAMLGYTAKVMGKESNTLDYWREHIGSATDPQVVAKSPARSAATIRAPILLMHGSEDTVVPIEQSRIMANALKAKGKDFEFVELPGEDHWLSASATRVRTLTEMEKFLAKHLPTGPVAGAN